jgi:hypothetical protein
MSAQVIPFPRRTIEGREVDPADARAGMAWYNSLSCEERRQWHELAGSAVPAATWEVYKRESAGD